MKQYRSNESVCFYSGKVVPWQRGGRVGGHDIDLRSACMHHVFGPSSSG